MADQNITALPKKTSSQMAATDYLLGIDSAEGYQMLIQDLGDYIIQHATSSLAGANQTLAAAINGLNSKTTSSLTITDNTITANVNNLVKANRVVTLSLQIKFDPAPTLNQEIIIGTIPSGYVPSQTVDMTMTGLGSAVQPTDIAQLWLLQNGDVRFAARNTPTTNWYRVDTTYII